MAVGGINAVAIVGNLTHNPELRSTSSGTSVATLRVAVNGRMKINDEWQERADYFDVTVWGSMAENCERYLSKGSPVAVQGRLRQERWEHEGNSRSRVLIVASSVHFLPTRRKDDGESSHPQGGGEAQAPDDDIPF